MKKKHAGGRPTDYEPIYCQMLIDHMAQGFSFESFAGKIKVSRSTIYKWVDDFKEFSDAKSKGLEQNLLFWEDAGIRGLYNETIKDDQGMTVTRSINSTVWIFNMKNRHMWRDKSAAEIKEEKEDRPLRELTDAELAERLKKK